MKYLNQFLNFNWNAFADGKRFLVTGCKPWQDFKTKKNLGTAVEVVIYKDETPYEQKDGEKVTNLFEKLTFKVNKELDIAPKTFVKPIDVTATIYGDYRNQLSVKCKDITTITQGKQP